MSDHKTGSQPVRGPRLRVRSAEFLYHLFPLRNGDPRLNCHDCYEVHLICKKSWNT